MRIILRAALTLSLIIAFALPALASAGNYQQAKAAITLIFGPYASQAMRVSGCETGHTYDPKAQNGQYLGIFQMGSYARTRYGHGPGWLVQAAAAYQYFVDSGRDWSPWTCGYAARE